MDPSPLKTEIDVAKVLLKDGWRPGEINSVLQYPLTDEVYQRLGAASLFFLMSDDFLAEEAKFGAKTVATHRLLQLGWLEAEVKALLKPIRTFSPQSYQDFQDDAPANPSPLLSKKAHSPQQPKSQTSTVSRQPQSSVPKAKVYQQLKQYRRSMGINRLFGLLLILIALVLFIFTL